MVRSTGPGGIGICICNRVGPAASAALLGPRLRPSAAGLRRPCARRRGGRDDSNARGQWSVRPLLRLLL